MEAIEIAFYTVGILASLFGAAWALYKYREFRQSKHWIEFDVDANIIKFSSPVDTTSYTRDEYGHSKIIERQPHTHAVEISLTFRNRGKTRVRLYNVQVAIQTMRAPEKTKYHPETGHLRLKRIFTSGNLVEPPTRKPVLDAVRTPFYYNVEPAVTQIVRYLALITEPKELLQIIGKFSLEQERIFPLKEVGRKRLYPVLAVRTYYLDDKKR
jgi:hypothetical protein